MRKRMEALGGVCCEYWLELGLVAVVVLWVTSAIVSLEQRPRRAVKAGRADTPATTETRGGSRE